MSDEKERKARVKRNGKKEMYQQFLYKNKFHSVHVFHHLRDGKKCLID